MRTRTVLAASLAIVLAAALILLVAPRKGSERSSIRPPASAPSSRVIGIPDRARGASPAALLPFAPVPLNQPTIAAELLHSTDVRATYEKYKSVKDPTGEVSYFLSTAVDDCTPFIGKTPGQVGDSMNALGRPIDSPNREKLIRKLIDRCKGFSGWNPLAVRDHYEKLRQRALDAGYPAAVAQDLEFRMAKEGTDKTDATAISLLSRGVDDGVVKGIYSYLLARNGNAWLKEQGDPSAVQAAWMLLQCNMGADCGAMSRGATIACLYYGECETQDTLSSLPAMYPVLDPVQLQSAISIETTLGNAIRDRDWARLGFMYVKRQAGPG